MRHNAAGRLDAGGLHGADLRAQHLHWRGEESGGVRGDAAAGSESCGCGTWLPPGNSGSNAAGAGAAGPGARGSHGAGCGLCGLHRLETGGAGDFGAGPGIQLGIYYIFCGGAYAGAGRIFRVRFCAGDGGRGLRV